MCCTSLIYLFVIRWLKQRQTKIKILLIQILENGTIFHKAEQRTFCKILEHMSNLSKLLLITIEDEAK